MSELLRDLYAHQAWADAEHWRAIAAHQPAADDRIIQERLRHIHVVQRAFLWATRARGGEFPITELENLSIQAVRDDARDYHEEVTELVGGLSVTELAEPLTIPWFREPSLTITREQALVQCAMHSHYHRAQNATRLRELGGTPPLTDFIVWLWKNKPGAVWE
jgi:uncharacterized damage-inducible protein DinB